jgi:PAS domain S-box-containing protein
MRIPRWFADMRIRYKLFITYSALLLIAVGAGMLALESHMNRFSEDYLERELKEATGLIINMIKTSAAVSIKNHLRATAENNRDILRYFYDQYVSGHMTEAAAKEAAGSVLLSQRVGKTGYIFVWDVSKAPGSIVLAVHPKIQGKEVSNIDFVQAGAALKEGYMEYRWQNPGEERDRGKAMYLAYFEPWKWIIAASTYKEEFVDLIDVSDFKDNILSVRTELAGYCYVLDGKGDLIIHPKLEGNAYSFADKAGRAFLQELCAKKSGKLKYLWKNPDDRKPREKLVVFNYIPEYDWIVASSGYEDGFTTPLHRLISLVIVATGLIVLLVLAISFFVGRRITAPLQRLVEAFQSTDLKNLTTRLPVESQDEIGCLELHFNRFMENLEQESIRRRILIDQSRDGIVIIDQDGKVYEANRSFADMLGYTLDEIRLMYMWDWDACWTREELQEVVRPIDQIKPQIETRHRRKDGTIYDVEISINVTTFGGRKLAFCVHRDITERKRADEERSRLVMAIEQIAEGVIIIDPGWCIQYANPAFGRITGYDTQEIIGMPERVLKSDQHEQAYYKQLREALARGETWSGRLINKRKDGTLYVAEVTASAVLDKSGAIINYVSIHRDITRELKLEKKLNQAQKMEAIGNLAGGIAHDFNNILAAIMGYTELSLLQVPEGNPVRGNLDQVLEAASRARDVVKQILTFSRQDEQEYKPVRIVPIVQEAVRFLRSSIPTTVKMTQDIAIDLDGGLIRGDSTQIHQVLLNLCTNAAHAMRAKGGALIIRLHQLTDVSLVSGDNNLRKGPYVCLAVTDTGHGMEAAVMERIFDPYFTTKGPGEGTGLGLSVVQGIVKNHGGAITVNSESGRGTTFNVFLPLLDVSVGSEAQTMEPLSNGSERILFVDDDETLVDLGKEMLETLGYHVTAQTNSPGALEAFRAAPDAFDLLITDMTMPGLTGILLVKEVMDIRPDIPAILCTGFSDQVDEKKARDAGISEYVMKPYQIAAMARTIRKVLDRNKSARKGP